jgi:phage baseplate assembly protein gpV
MPRTVQGVQVATVVDNLDPQQSGRIQITVPPPSGAKGRPTTAWARLATLSAGDGRGTWFLPAVGDEVLVAFEEGDPSRPIVVGSLWAAGASVPETGAERTTIRTRTGAVISIEEPPSGPATITIDSGTGSEIEVGPAGVRVRAAGRIELESSALRVSAGTLEVNSAMAKFGGVVQCDTLIATNVMASNYTPGSGNAW